MILFWYWWAAALLLLGMEILVPGTYFLWMAVAAVIIGNLMLAFPETGIAAQIAIFAILSMIAILIGRKYFRNTHYQSEQPLLNQRAVQHLGQTAILVQPLSNGEGRIKIGGTFWRVRGPDAAQGSIVKIIDTDGMTLFVELIDSHQ
jgi:membrane protein implicated in regulation of membrane protease activity